MLSMQRLIGILKKGKGRKEKRGVRLGVLLRKVSFCLELPATPARRIGKNNRPLLGYKLKDDLIQPQTLQPYRLSLNRGLCVEHNQHIHQGYRRVVACFSLPEKKSLGQEIASNLLPGENIKSWVYEILS